MIPTLLIFTTLAASIEEERKTTIYAEIRVVDSATGRGVPLVELETVDAIIYVTDNAGRIAFDEPDLMNEELFFTVRSPGYEVPKDGFGFRGVRITPSVGKPVTIKIDRLNVAERLCRLTGEGCYRDTQLLGLEPPLKPSPHPGKVVGQDSVQSVIYHNKVFYLWGDTLRKNYPLGLFRSSAATTPIPDANFDPADGIAYDYFTDAKTGFVRAMMPLAERPEGVIWIFSLVVVTDEMGEQRLIGHYDRRKGLGEIYEHGIALFNDEKLIFEPAVQLPMDEKWRMPKGHPIVFEEGNKKWILFGSPNPNVRVPATLKDVLDPSKYEAFHCTFSAEGKPEWRWQKEEPPTDSKQEQQWIRDKKLMPEDARFAPANVADLSQRITLHSGSVRWNPHRNCWIMLAGQVGGTSFLGEVWYTEADHPTGPFTKAVKVVTHDKQTFYNVCHHAFLDRDGGRTIYFEGTYTNDFSGNPVKTPRYNYNQLLYRLDLDAEALKPSRDH